MVISREPLLNYIETTHSIIKASHRKLNKKIYMHFFLARKEKSIFLFHFHEMKTILIFYKFSYYRQIIKFHNIQRNYHFYIAVDLTN